MKRTNFPNPLFYLPTLLAAIVVLATACGKEKNRLSAIDDDKQVPTLIIDSLHMLYTESGLLRMDLKAPSMQRYMLAPEPYSVFKDGMVVFFYTPDKVLESEIRADYALNKEKPEETWLAINNVEIINYLKQQSLYTDTLHWNRATKTIYTTAPVRIVTPDGEIIGKNGMTSDERFNDYEIRAVKDSYIYANDEAPLKPDSTATPAAVTEELLP